MQYKLKVEYIFLSLSASLSENVFNSQTMENDSFFNNHICSELLAR